MPNELDMDEYHKEGIDPGGHKEFTINPDIHSFNDRFGFPMPPKDRPGGAETGAGAQSQGMFAETGWMEHPSFKERWEGMPKETTQLMEDLRDPKKMDAFMHPANEDMVIQWLLRNKQNPAGWVANQLPKYSPSMDYEPNFMRAPMPADREGRGPSLEWQRPPTFPGFYDQNPEIMPYNPDRPESGMYPIADIENSIQSLADKHGVEGSKMKGIITDVLKNPTDYISPMPGEMGMAAPKGAAYDPALIRSMLQAGKRLSEIGEHYGVSGPSISNYIRNMGISNPNPGGSPKMATTKELFERLDRGELQKDIAKDLGVSPSSLSNRLKNEGLTKQTAEEWRDLREFYKNQFEGGPTEPEFRGMKPEDFNKYNELAAARARRDVANVNKPGEGEPEHPLWSIFHRWLGPAPTTPYEKLVARQADIRKTKQQGFAGADRNQYPLSYKIKDADTNRELYKINTYLDEARDKWDFDKFGGEDVFRKEFEPKFKMREELIDRINKMPIDNPELNKASAKSMLDHIIKSTPSTPAIDKLMAKLRNPEPPLDKK